MSKNKNNDIEFDRDLSPIDNKIKGEKKLNVEEYEEEEEEDSKNKLFQNEENKIKNNEENPNQIKNNENKKKKNQTSNSYIKEEDQQLEKNQNFNIVGKKKFQEIGIEVDFIPDIILKEKEKINKDFVKKEKIYQQQIEQLNQNFLKKEKELKKENEEINNSLIFERNMNLETINRLKEDMKIKDNNLKKISKTNEMLTANLKKLSEQVNNLFNQLTKQKQFIKKLNQEPKSKEEKSFEEQLKMKDIQIKSTQNLIEVLSKENKDLKEKLEKYGDYNSKIELLDSVRYKDSENLKLIQEIKDLKTQLEEHKKCEIKNNNNIKIINDFTNKISKYKEKFDKLKIECENLKEKLNEKQNINPNKTIQYKTYNLNKNYKNNNGVSNNYINNIYKKGFQKNLQYSLYNKRNLSPTLKSKKLNPSKSTNDIKRSTYSLFSENEKKAISTLFNNQDELNNFNKKISILESYKNSNNNLLKSNIRKLNSELSNKEEQIQYLQSKNKENELRLVVSINRINEGKVINMNLKKKINEQKEIIENALKDIQIKKEENNNMYNELRKLKLDLKDSERLKSSSYSELRKNKELDSIKEMLQYSDINIDTDALKEENKNLTRNKTKIDFNDSFSNMKKNESIDSSKKKIKDENNSLKVLENNDDIENNNNHNNNNNDNENNNNNNNNEDNKNNEKNINNEKITVNNDNCPKCKKSKKKKKKIEKNEMSVQLNYLDKEEIEENKLKSQNENK